VTTPPLTIRILIAEDHALVRAGIRSLLGSMHGVEVTGEAVDGREAVAMVADLLPDLVLMDLTMPGLNGLQAIRRLTIEYPSVKVLVLSMHDGEEYVSQAFRAGAAGYLLKDSSAAELELAIHSIATRGSYVSPSISALVIADYVRRDAGRSVASDPLTSRQREVLQLIAEGRTNQDMAEILDLSIKTIESHRSQLMERLDIHDVAGLVRYAVRNGVVPVDG
jgi:DNA-binding NarL/FixJ family response regulator